MSFFLFYFQIDENENLPKSICDSCIVQLNVAYNFKKNAIQSDIKLRQYLIEYGVGIFPYNGINNGNVPLLRTSNSLMPINSAIRPAVEKPRAQNNNESNNGNISTNGSNTLRPFPVMPLIIKEEPIDYETMSDITIETNAEAYDGQYNDDNRARNSNTVPQHNNHRQEILVTPTSSHSMVTLNDKSLLISTSTPNSDGDFISAYLPTPSSTNDHSPVESTASLSSNSLSKRCESFSSKATYQSNEQTQKLPVQLLKATEKSTKRKISATNDNKASDFKSNVKEKSIKRSYRGPLAKLEIDMKTSSTEPIQTNSNSRMLRTHDGSVAKKDYHSFFRSTRAINPLNQEGRQELYKQMKTGTKKHSDSVNEKHNSVTPTPSKNSSDLKLKTNKINLKLHTKNESALKRDRRLSVYRSTL